MSKKPNSKKFKIIQFKDIVSLSVIVVMLFCSFTYTHAASLKSLFGKIEDAVDKAKNTASSVVDTVKNTASSVVDTAKNTASSVVDTTKNVVSSVADTTKNVVSSAVETAKNTASSVADTTKNVVSSVAETAKNTANSVVDAAKNVVNSAEKSMVISAVKDAVTSVRDINQGIIENAMAGTLINTLRVLNIFDKDVVNTKENKDITANNLLEFNKTTESIFGNKSNYTVSTNLNKLTFKPQSIKENDNDLSNDEWQLTNCTRVQTISTSNKDQFPMNVCTFVKEDNNNIEIVISYRQTESLSNWLELLMSMNEAKMIQGLTEGNWGTNIASLFTGFTGAETEARAYAQKVAAYYFQPSVKKGRTISIHVTGYSLGGYLAQIGGAALLQNSTYKNSVKQIGYFNGRGLSVDHTGVITGTSAKVTEKIIEIVYGKKYDFKTDCSIIKNAYSTLNKNKEIVTLYKTRGDWCSVVGEHVGNTREYYANSKHILEYRKGYNTTDRGILITALNVFSGIFDPTNINMLASYVDTYRITNMMDYMFATHHLNGFEGWDLVNEKRNVNIEKIYFDKVPSTMKKGTQKTLNIAIKLNNAVLNENLTKSDFVVSNNIEIVKVAKTVLPNGAKTTGDYSITYTIQITIKAKANVTLPTIKLKNNAFKISPSKDFEELYIQNNSKTGSYLNNNK